MSYKILVFSTHADVNFCRKHFKTVRQAYAILIDEKAREAYGKEGLEIAEEELCRRKSDQSKLSEKLF